MSTASQDIPVIQQTRYFGPAEVLDVQEDKGLVLLQIEGTQEDETWARLAIPYSSDIVRGEMVLAAGEDVHNLYIIGLLNNKTCAGTGEKQISTKDGASANVNAEGETEKLEVRSGSGEVIFEYDPEKGKSRVNIQSGDLEFVTKKGSINFISAKNIHFFCRESMEMMSMQGIRMAIARAKDKMISSLAISSEKMKIQSPDLDISADKGTIGIKETAYTGEKVSCSVESAGLTMDRLDSTVNTAISKAKNVYKTVEGLTQLYTKQMRTLVDSSYHFKSKKAFLKAEEDFKINAENIHLG